MGCILNIKNLFSTLTTFLLTCYDKVSSNFSLSDKFQQEIRLTTAISWLNFPIPFSSDTASNNILALVGCRCRLQTINSLNLLIEISTFQ